MLPITRRMASPAVRSALRQRSTLIQKASIAPARVAATPRQTLTGAGRRRLFHTDPVELVEPQFTPGEEIMLDSTAWFVAFALCWSPDHEYDDLDYQGYSDMQEQASRNRKKDNHDSEKKQKNTAAKKKSDHGDNHHQGH